MGLPEKTGNGQEETGGAGGEPAEPTGGNRPFRCVEMAAKSGEEVWSRPQTERLMLFLCSIAPQYPCSPGKDGDGHAGDNVF